MNCEIISASAGTGKTYTMAIKYLKALNEGVNFENILVITFTKKATAEIRERIMIFLEKIIYQLDDYKELEKNIGDNINNELLKKAYEDMLKNSENIKIFTNDSFINKIFKQIVAPKYNIYNYEINEENSDKYIDTILNEIILNKEYFELFKKFYKLDNKTKEIENYRDLIKSILNNRTLLYKSVDDFSNLQKEKVRDFDEIKNYVLEYLNNNQGKKYTNLAKRFFTAKKITDLNDITSSGLISRSKDDFETEFKEEILKDLVKIYVNEVIIPYNIYYKKLAKICYEIDEKLKFINHNFTFNDIAFFTNKSDIHPEKVFSNIDIVMIDEFQDTDSIQFDIILKIIKKAKSLFIVGDEKQAIYSFRGGDVSLFKNLEKLLIENIKDINITKNHLNVCYRSTKNIIDYVNKYFTDLHEYNYENVSCIKNGGSVKVLNPDDNIVEHLVQNNLMINCAILARDNKSLDKYKKDLDINNVKYESVQSIKLKNDKNVKSILKLIDYLVTDNFYSLLEFLRSDLVGYTLEKLKKVIEKKNFDEVLNLKKEGINFKKEYLKIFGYGINPEKEDILNLNKILDIISTFYNLTDFLEYFYDKGKNLIKENVSVENGLSLTTIHKSKGLEYDTVYAVLPYTEDKFINFTKVKLDNDVIFLKRKKYLEHHKYNKYIQKHLEYQKQEMYNVIYVALTRAKNNLIICPVGTAANKLNFEKLNELGEISKTKEIITKESTVNFSNSKFFENTKYIIKCYQENNSIKKEQKRKLGLAIHYFMENIKYEDDIPLAKSMFYRKYANLVGPILTKKIIDTCCKYINNHNKMFAKNLKIYTEYKIFDENGKEYRIDRLAINEKTKQIIIYDYKTKENAYLDEKYKTQIQNYKCIIENMIEYKNYKVKTEILPIILNNN